MEYRKADGFDALGLEALIKEYCQECGFTYNQDAVQKYLLWGLHNTYIYVAVKDEKIVGVINFMVAPHHFTGEPSARKMAWFVSKDHRGKAGLELLKLAEDSAKELGAKDFYVATPTKMFTDYMPLETEYRKIL